jgi:hypothetical protein
MLFWAVATFIIAVVAWLVAVLAWRLGAPRRLVTYSVLGTTPPLGGGHWAALRDVQFEVLLNGNPLPDPHVAILRVENRSRRDIRSSDFDREQFLVFNLGAKLVYAETNSA